MESTFQFKSPILTKLEFGLNEKFESKSNKVEIKTQMTVNVAKNDKKNEAIVELNIEIGSQDESAPYFVKVIEQSAFRWDEDLEDVDSLLNVNAPALLLSYARPIIAQVTSASPYNAYNIPFMNFTKNK